MDNKRQPSEIAAQIDYRNKVAKRTMLLIKYGYMGAVILLGTYLIAIGLNWKYAPFLFKVILGFTILLFFIMVSWRMYYFKWFYPAQKKTLREHGLSLGIPEETQAEIRKAVDDAVKGKGGS